MQEWRSKQRGSSMLEVFGSRNLKADASMLMYDVLLHPQSEASGDMQHLSTAIAGSVTINRDLVLIVPLIEARWRWATLANLIPLILDLTDAGLTPTANIVRDFDQLKNVLLHSD
jgi:hypothetical protein